MINRKKDVKSIFASSIAHCSLLIAHLHCSLFIVLCLFVFVVSACGKITSAPQGGIAAPPLPTPHSPFATFRDIPGVTDGEISKIDALRRDHKSFVYGMTMTTETFLKTDGAIGGYAALFCKWMTEMFGIPFIPAIYTWEDLWSGLESGDVDFTGDLMATGERQKILFMTDAIVERSLSSFQVAGADSIPVIAMTRPPRLAFLENSAVLDRVEPLVDYKFEPVFYGDNSGAYKMLESGDVDAILVMGISEASFDTYGNVKSETFFPLVYNSASLSTRNANLVPVINVVQKALQYESTRRYLMDLYKDGYNEYRRHKLFLRLDKDELAYLRNNPVVYMAAEHDNYPASFYNGNEKQWQGAVFDVLHEVTDFTGLSFEVANNPGVDFYDLVRMLENGKVSLISELLYSREREGRFLWPNTAIMTDFSTLISKSDYPSITLSEILNIRVGVAKGTAHAELFKRWFPNHGKLFEYDNTYEVWDALERGDIDMVMSRQNQFLSMSNYKERAGFKINVTFENYFNATFGINKNEVILCSILNKTLDLVDTKRIAGNWTNRFLDYRYKMMEARLPWLVGAIALSLIALALLLALIYRGRNERKLLVKQQAAVEAASRAKSSFLATMSHEMRTPMNAIIGMTTIGRNSGDIERKDYALIKIEDAAVHLLSVINDVLDLSKIEANKLELSPVEFDFERMLQGIVNIINFRMDEKHQRFTLNLDEHIPRFIVADDHRLSQVMVNLLSNAVKFTPEQGEIGLSITLADEKDGICEICVEVSDNGIGISGEQQKKLFRAFEQADSGISREFGGTGLGLSISKHIVDLMDGRIWVESEQGKGSRFIFTVKVKRGTDNADFTLAAGIKSELDLNGRFVGKKLLIVEDVEINREILISLLQETGLSIDCAQNGLEAVEMIIDAPGRYDVVLMDIQMPKMDGFEATRQIRVVENEVPIIAMTAHVFTSDIEECLAAGMNDHIGKPFDIEDVLRKLYKYLYEAEK